MADEASEITLSQLQSWKESDGQEVKALFPGIILLSIYWVSDVRR